MRKFYYLALAALVGIAFSSCSLLGGDKNPQFRMSDLEGYWLQTNDNTDHYVRFTTDQSDEAGYLLGYEWHEKDPAGAVYESDVLQDSLGDGWFKYKLETKGELEEVILMTNKGAEYSRFYTVTKLTSENLEYYDQRLTSSKYYFSKVVKSNN